MDTNYDDLSFMQKALDSGKNEGQSGVWNIFVQILLPLVLVLTFVAVMDIMKYRDVAEKEKERARELQEKYYQKIDKYKQEIQKNYALIKLQLQKLLVEFEKVKKERMKKIKLDMFPDANRIKLQAANLSDKDFKILCTETNEIFKNNSTEQAEKDAMYISVINRVEDVFDNQIDKKETGSPLVKMHYNIPADDPHIINISEITPPNRMKIHNKIIEFVSTLKVEVIQLQTDLIHKIFEYLLENPEELDENLKRSADEMLLAKDEKIKQEKAEKFYRQLIEKWERNFEGNGYKLLKDTWGKFKFIEFDQRGGNK